MSQQLSLFASTEAVAPTILAKLPTVPAQKVTRKPSPSYDIEQDGEYYHVWYDEEYDSTYLGFIYHIGGKTWGLYFPGERGVCGFGGPSQQGAAAELHQCFIRRAKGLEV
jgi:hypothetical protein